MTGWHRGDVCVLLGVRYLLLPRGDGLPGLLCVRAPAWLDALEEAADELD